MQWLFWHSGLMIFAQHPNPKLNVQLPVTVFTCSVHFEVAVVKRS